MTPDQERYAEALAIERLHGDDAPRWLAERIGALTRAGNGAGVRRFVEIARRLDALRFGRARSDLSDSSCAATGSRVN